MRRWVHMRDFWTVRSKELTRDQSSKDSKGESLLVRVAATHSGIVNGNMRFYRPDRMQDAVHTWVPKAKYPRPVLVAHNEDGDVVGRVLDAKYVDESYKYKTEHTVLRDSLFYGTDARKKMDLYKSIDWIVDNLMTQDDYQGLGYVELGLKVTNPDAIQKVMRDEYLTVSVGFKTDAAVCSICHTDWAQDDKCEHKLGETVDGKQMFLISGHFDYEEVSFVNFPADPFASTVSKERLADNLGKTFFLGLPVRQQRALTASTGLHFTDSLYAADIHLVEGDMAEVIVDPKVVAEMASVEAPVVAAEERDAVLAEAEAAKEAAAAETSKVADKEETKYSDAVQTVASKLNLTDGKGEKSLKMLNGLDDTYKGLEDEEKGLFRSAVGAMLEVWSADGWLNFLKEQLAKDSTLVVRSKDEAEAETAELAKVVAEKDTVKGQAASYFMSYKRGLAQTIALFKVTSGKISKDDVPVHVTELLKRNVSSLKDTVSDILSELKLTEKTEVVEAKVDPVVAVEDASKKAAVEEKPAEAVLTDNDNVRVAEPVPASSKTDEEGAVREHKLREAARLAAMSPMERMLYIADAVYDQAKNRQ
jgi:hypothetical protein